MLACLIIQCPVFFFLVPLTEPYNLEKYVPSADKAMGILEEEMVKLQEERLRNIDDSNAADSNMQSEFQASPSEEDDISGDMFAEDNDATPEAYSHLSVEQELHIHFDEPKQPKDSDPLVYWRRNATRLPLLAQLARRYLAFPAGSGDIERTFSVSGSLARSRRANLTAETIERILMHREDRL